VSQVTTDPQNTHRPIYVDSVPHVNPDDQYTNQRHVADPQGITHPQSTYVSTYDDSIPHAKPHNQYINQPPCIDPSTSHSQTMHRSIYVDSGLHNALNSQDEHTNQPPYIDPGTSHPQNMYDSVYVDSGDHINRHEQYTNQSYDVGLQGPPHSQNTHHSTYIDSVPHVNPDDQYTHQRHDADLQAASHPRNMHVLTYDDSIPHAKTHDQYVNRLTCIGSDDSRSQTMHHSEYVDSGFRASNSQDQYTNQSCDIGLQGPPHSQNTHRSTYIDSVPHVNPDDQYTNQRHDADPQGISHPQSTYVSTYDDLRPHANPHDQSTNHSNFSDDHPGPEQFILASQTTHYLPAHRLNHYHRVGDAYYHAPRPEMSYERPDPLVQSSDRMHSLFDVHNAGNRVEGEPPVNLEPAVGHQHDFNRLRYHRTLSRHTPYTVSKRRNDYLTLRDVEHGEGSSHSAAQSVLPLVLDSQPVTVPPPVAPTTPSPTPVVLPQSALNSCTSVVFGVADLPKVKAAALFRMKCTIFINSFFLDTATVGKMARQCMDAEVSHDGKLLELVVQNCHWLTRNVDDLVAWSKTSDGEVEVSKLCKALGTIKKNIQFLSRSAVLWGYDLHYLLMEKPKKEVKEFISKLIKNNRFLYGVIDASHCLPLSCARMLMLFSSDSRHESGNCLREYRNPILCPTALPS